MVYDTNFNPVDILPKFLISDGILPRPPKNVYEVRKIPYPWAKRTDLIKELAKSDIKTVILCRRFGLGDIIQLIPSLAYLQENYPHIEFIFATIPDFMPLFQSDERYKVMNVRYIDMTKYDLGVNLDYSVEQDLMLNSDLRFKHRIHTYAGMLGISLENPVIDLKISKEALIWANSLIEKSRINKKKVIVLQLEGASVSRQLPRDLMLHLAKTLNQLCDVVLVDKGSAKVDVTYNLAGKTDIQQLMAIIKVADALISFDSGCLWLSHIAKTPILTLMGPTRPQEKLSLHPLYPERARAVMVNNTIGCPESCLYQGGKWCGGQFKCMANLPREFYDAVINKIVEETIELLSIEKPYHYISFDKPIDIKIPSSDKAIIKKKEIVLVKRSGGIGDVLMTTPILTEIKKKNPDTEIYYETLYPELFEGNPDVCVSFVSNKVKINNKVDKIIDLNRSVETKQVGGGILDEEVSEKNNRIDLFFDHAKINRQEKPEIKYFLKEDEVERAKLLLKENGIREYDILIGYAGIPVAHRRAYPLELTKKLFNLLCRNPRVKIILFGRGKKSFVKEDQVIIDTFPKDRILDFIDKTSMREVAAIMNHCKLVIACDSGLLHLANAVKVPNVGLFGTIEPWLRTKYYPLCRTIYPKNRLPCIPCNDKGRECKSWSRIDKYQTIGGECMWKITPEEIRDTVFQYLEKTISQKRKPNIISKEDNSIIVKLDRDIDTTINKLILPKNEWKVLFPVASIEANHYAGGLIHIWEIVHALLANNCNVVVVSKYKPLFDRDFRDYPNRDKLHIIVDINYGKRITEKSFCFDFVMGMQTCGDVAVELAKRFKVPSYLWLFDPPNYAERYKKIKNFIREKWLAYKYALEKANYVIISTETVRKWTESWLNGQSHRKITQMYPCINSIEADKIANVEKKNEVVFLGRITSDKHPEILFGILKDLKKPPVINFIGPIDIESNLLKKFQDLSKETGIQYKIYEKIPDKEKFEILARSKLLIYPSNYEAFGLPPLEANYVKTPSIVYDLPPYKEWAGSSLNTIPVGDTKALKIRTKDILTSKQKEGEKKLKELASFERLQRDIKKITPPFRPSVIMTIYNEEEYLEYALKSIYDWAWEIIIVEAVVENMFKVTNSYTSTDRTSEIIEQFIKKYDKEGKIKYKKFYRTFKDKIELQNEALKEVTGNIFFKLDGDEVYKKEHLELLKEAFISNPEIDLVYFTTLNFWASFRLVTKGTSWDVAHFKILRYKEGMKYVDGHSQMRDREGDNIDWHKTTKYKTIYMPEVINYHFGWCKKARFIENKLNFVRNRTFDHYDNAVHNTYSKWKHGDWSNPYESSSGLVYPYYDTLPAILKNHPYYNIEDVRKLK